CYRHGGAGMGVGATKVYTRSTLNYDGTDGLGPLNVVTTYFHNKISWYKVSGEPRSTYNAACEGTGATPYEASPWNIIHNTNNYILYAPVASNSSQVNQRLPPNPCATTAIGGTGAYQGPEGDPGQPSPGTVF